MQLEEEFIESFKKKFISSFGILSEDLKLTQKPSILMEKKSMIFWVVCDVLNVPGHFKPDKDFHDWVNEFVCENCGKILFQSAVWDDSVSRHLCVNVGEVGVGGNCEAVCINGYTQSGNTTYTCDETGQMVGNLICTASNFLLLKLVASNHT